MATSQLIDFTPPMARPIVKPGVESLSTKQKQSRPTKTNGTNKYTKKI